VTPLILLTGFLGSGKTTLIAQLLRHRAARAATGKIALLVNELGSIGIDGELLADGITQQIELPGGCVCCAIGDDFAKALLTLVESQPTLEAIVLETTGVAEPLPIAWALERSPLREKFRLATVITVVDALHFMTSRGLSASVDSQVAYADVLVMSKGELATFEQRQQTEQVTRSLAGRCLFYNVPLAEAAAILDDMISEPGSRRIDVASSQCDADCEHDHDHSHGVDVHTHGIASASFLLRAAAIDIEELEDAIALIPQDVIRVKGVARVSDGPSEYWLAFHRVGLRFSSERLPGDERKIEPRIVVLGPNLALPLITASLASILARVS
jgi:G3E family GTPase